MPENNTKKIHLVIKLSPDISPPLAVEETEFDIFTMFQRLKREQIIQNVF